MPAAPNFVHNPGGRAVEEKILDLLLRESRVLIYGSLIDPLAIHDDDVPLFEEAKALFTWLIPSSLSGIDYIREVYRITDELTEQYRQRQHVVCASGCMVCCRQLVTCTPYEFMHILEHLKQLPKNEAAAIFGTAKERAAETASEVRRGMQEQRAANQRESMSLARQIHYGRPCMFLDESAGVCSIYPVRPIDCRVAFVRGQQCRGENYGEAIPCHPFFSKIAALLIYDECSRRLKKNFHFPIMDWITNPMECMAEVLS
jgi:Fe-S-cluster containining protein